MKIGDTKIQNNMNYAVESMVWNETSVPVLWKPLGLFLNLNRLMHKVIRFGTMPINAKTKEKEVFDE